jgi:hypothetical protein
LFQTHAWVPAFAGMTMWGKPKHENYVEHTLKKAF